MLLPALPQSRSDPHADFGSRDAAVSGAGDCCASLFTAAGAGWEAVKIRKRTLFSFSAMFLQAFSISRSFSAYPLLLSVFLALLFLDNVFPSHVYSPFCFIQMQDCFHYFCFPFVYCILFHFHFLPIFSFVSSQSSPPPFHHHIYIFLSRPTFYSPLHIIPGHTFQPPYQPSFFFYL